MRLLAPSYPSPQSALNRLTVAIICTDLAAEKQAAAQNGSKPGVTKPGSNLAVTHVSQVAPGERLTFPGLRSSRRLLHKVSVAQRGGPVGGAPGGRPSPLTSDSDPTVLCHGDWPQTRSCKNTFHMDRSRWASVSLSLGYSARIGTSGSHGNCFAVPGATSHGLFPAVAQPLPPAAPMSPHLRRHWLPPVPVASLSSSSHLGTPRWFFTPGSQRVLTDFLHSCGFSPGSPSPYRGVGLCGPHSPSTSFHFSPLQAPPVPLHWPP